MRIDLHKLIRRLGFVTFLVFLAGLSILVISPSLSLACGILVILGCTTLLALSGELEPTTSSVARTNRRLFDFLLITVSYSTIVFFTGLALDSLRNLTTPMLDWTLILITLGFLAQIVIYALTLVVVTMASPHFYNK